MKSANMIVQIGSATLGRGKPLFPRRSSEGALKLISAQKMSAGFVELRYEVGE